MEETDWIFVAAWYSYLTSSYYYALVLTNSHDARVGGSGEAWEREILEI